MRRASLFVLSLFFSSVALAAEPNLRQPERPIVEGIRHMIVHANGPLTAADRAELAGKGIFIGRALTDGRYFANVREVVADARLSRIEEIAAEKKISATAMREARSGRTWAEVAVYFHDDVTIDDARTALLAAGAALEDPFAIAFDANQRLNVKVAPSALSAIAADDNVLAITGPIRFKVVTDNAKTAALSRVNEVQQAPYNLTGAGVTVSLFELALAQTDHVEFGGRYTVQGVSGGTSSDARHATHTAGTISASGVNPDAKGMAPNVKIIELCVRVPSNTCKNNFLTDKERTLAQLGSRIDNNSWGFQLGWDVSDFPYWNFGDDYFGAYELEITSPIDDYALENNILFVHSAGNEGEQASLNSNGQHRHVDDNVQIIAGKIWCYSKDGSGTDCPAAPTCNGDPDPCEKVPHHPQTPYDTIGFTAAGKNSIAVGAVQTIGDTIDIVSFSSRGPADDGRVKPDVVARGYSVLSAVPNNSYRTLDGTSMAAPAVTGIAALLVEQWRQVFSGATPDPVTLKALIIAGARDIGRPGPDYTFGYGLADAKNSADLIRDDLGTGQRIRSFTFTNGQTQEQPIVVSTPQDLRVVLQWGDPAIPLSPGQLKAEKALVNDLDMKVIGPNGAEHLPYVLNPEQFEANATTGVNNRDNTEEIEIKGAAAGTYRVVITGREIRTTDQRAVLVSNARFPVCQDFTESGGVYGDLVTGQTINAALCAAGDVDEFRFQTLPGAVALTFRTGDTPIVVTISGAVNSTVTIPANTSQTISNNYSGTGLAAVNVRVQAAGTMGADPVYSFTPAFKAQTGPRRRSTRH